MYVTCCKHTGWAVIFCHKKGGPKVAENRATDRRICCPKCTTGRTISWSMADVYARITERILPIGQDIQSYLKRSKRDRSLFLVERSCGSRGESWRLFRENCIQLVQSTKGAQRRRARGQAGEARGAPRGRLALLRRPAPGQARTGGGWEAPRLWAAQARRAGPGHPAPKCSERQLPGAVLAILAILAILVILAILENTASCLSTASRTSGATPNSV
jgi:hypothetical protein